MTSLFTIYLFWPYKSKSLLHSIFIYTWKSYSPLAIVRNLHYFKKINTPNTKSPFKVLHMEINIYLNTFPILLLNNLSGDGNFFLTLFHISKSYQPKQYRTSNYVK